MKHSIQKADDRSIQRTDLFLSGHDCFSYIPSVWRHTTSCIRRGTVLEVHKTVGTALAQGNKEDERAWKVMERTNISMLVLQDNQVIFSPRGDQEQLVSQLRGYVFNQNQDEGELLKKYGQL